MPREYRRANEPSRRTKAQKKVDSLAGDVEAVARMFGAEPNDLRRLIVTACQRDPHLIRDLQLGALTLYAREICVRILNGQADVPFDPEGLIAAAIKEAEVLRRTRVLTSHAMPGDAPQRSTPHRPA